MSPAVTVTAVSVAGGSRWLPALSWRNALGYLLPPLGLVLVCVLPGSQHFTTFMGNFPQFPSSPFPFWRMNCLNRPASSTSLFCLCPNGPFTRAVANEPLSMGIMCSPCLEVMLLILILPFLPDSLPVMMVSLLFEMKALGDRCILVE